MQPEAECIVHSSRLSTLRSMAGLPPLTYPEAEVRLLWCGYCRRTVRFSSEQPHSAECPTCQGRLQPLDSKSETGARINSMPPIVREAAKDPARHLGRFVIVRELGQGAMGTVHQAWDTGFGRWAAIKLLKSGLADEESLERFRREASVMTSLEHPTIAPAYDVVDFDGKLALIMKYIEGRTL